MRAVPHNEELAELVRVVLDRTGWSWIEQTSKEKKMFGGPAFMVAAARQC
jgi:hypothetical protein